MRSYDDEEMHQVVIDLAKARQGLRDARKDVSVINDKLEAADEYLAESHAANIALKVEIRRLRDVMELSIKRCKNASGDEMSWTLDMVETRLTEALEQGKEYE